jgi:4-hydroxy-3-polyprenylbenzoate decarboxylase
MDLAFKNLREFIAFLEERGELKRVRARVNPELEITEITDRVTKAGGPALLFENVEGSRLPVLINTFGSPQRTAWALGCEKWEELPKRLESLLGLALGGPPQSLMEKLHAAGELLKVARISPKVVDKAPCQEVVLTGEQVDLGLLPILKCWPLDAGRYITLPLVCSYDPNTGKRNVGVYRLQVLSKNTTAMHWQRHKGGREHYDEAVHKRERLQIAVALGAEPAAIYAGTAPLPQGIDEFVFAGFLRGEPIEQVQAKTVDVLVPANSEIVLEGYVEPGELVTEGPFGDHTGYYSLPDKYPVFHITAMTMRKDPIYVTTIVGRPPMEDLYLGKATERLFLPLIKLMVPEIVDLNMPVEGIFHNIVFVSIRKRFPGHARKTMYALWSLHQMMFAKFIVVVDDDIDVQNVSEVLFRMGNNVDWKRDTVIVEGPVDTLDHASPIPNYGGKMGVDATRKWAEEGFTREWPPDIVMSEEIKRLVTRRWREYFSS